MKKLLLINTSPRKKKTSYSFCRTMKQLWIDMGGKAEIVHAMDYHNKNNINSLLHNIKRSDIIAIVSPLYADALPYVGTWLLEKLYDEHDGVLKDKGLFTVGQCGFPDITRIEPITNTGRIFANQTEMKWYGALAYGGGAMLNGAHLESLGKRGKKMISAFKMALTSIYNGDVIQSDAQDKLTSDVPKLLYRPLCALLNGMAKKEAKKHGTDIKRKFYKK